jgi:hypothetical protein
MHCCSACGEDWLSLFHLVTEKAALEAGAQDVARGHQQRLLRLRQSQEAGCKCKKELLHTMAALWKMDVEDVKSCIDFGRSMQSAVEWVQHLENALEDHESGRFSTELQVCPDGLRHSALVVVMAGCRVSQLCVYVVSFWTHY